MNTEKRGRSAWGAACASCAAAKARCIRAQSSEQCDRCQSLAKNCVGQVSGPRKKRQIKSSFDTGRTASLEDEFNDLFGLSNTPGTESSIVHESSTNGSMDSVANNYPASASVERQPAGLTCTCMATINMEDLVPVESDDTLLSIYRNQLSRMFPFIVIPAGTTPAQLQETHPFLFKVIRMVASVCHLRLVRGQSRAIMEHVSTAILMKSEQSMDLLQGILVFLGFYHYHCMAHAQFNNLINLAVGLVEDLELTTCPKSQQRRSQMPLLRTAEVPVARTNEEKRLLLGVWYMSSNAGLVVRKLAFTGYTKYMNQCSRDLEDAGEYNSDKLVIHLVRIQRLTEKVFNFHGNDSLVDEQLNLPGPSTMTRLEAFRLELDSLQEALPISLKFDHILSCYHSSAHLRIFEPLLAGSHLPDADTQSFAMLSTSGVPIEDVFSDFTIALKAWLENWLAVPVCSYFYMPQPAYIQLVHGAMMLTRWVKVAGTTAIKLCNPGSAILPEQSTPALSGVPSCPDLSLPKLPPAASGSTQISAQILSRLRKNIATQPELQVDVLGVLDKMITRFEAAKTEMSAAQGLDWENDIWDVAAEHARLKKSRIERWCETIAMAAGDVRNVVADANDSYDRGREATDIPTPGYDWDNLQWESAMFDEFLQDIHT